MTSSMTLIRYINLNTESKILEFDMSKIVSSFIRANFFLEQSISRNSYELSMVRMMDGSRVKNFRNPSSRSFG